MPAVPSVSIIIPAYVTSPVQATHLIETLDSVAAQSFRDFEIIVVDDGSPRPLPDLAARPQLTVLGRRNGGSAQARNTGIAAARGAHVVFLDADDHLLPGALEAGVTALAAHPEAGYALGRREEMTYDGAPVPWGVPALPHEPRLYDILLGFDWHILPPSSAMFRRSVVDEVGGFRDPWGADDLDFYLRVAHRHLACFHDAVVTRYRRYSTSTSRDGERMLDSIRVVYGRQREHVRGNPVAEAAYERGLAQLTKIFTDCLEENLRDRIRSRQWRRALRSAYCLARERVHGLTGRGTRDAARATQ